MSLPLPIHSCYARDQNGRLLGHTSFQSQLKEAAAVAAAGGGGGDASTTTTPPTTAEHYLSFFILPGKTTCVKFYKIYKGENDEIKMYVSKAKFLVEAAFEAGLTNEVKDDKNNVMMEADE